MSFTSLHIHVIHRCEKKFFANFSPVSVFISLSLSFVISAHLNSKSIHLMVSASGYYQYCYVSAAFLNVSMTFLEMNEPCHGQPLKKFNVNWRRQRQSKLDFYLFSFLVVLLHNGFIFRLRLMRIG